MTFVSIRDTYFRDATASIVTITFEKIVDGISKKIFAIIETIPTRLFDHNLVVYIKLHVMY